ncbi:hypothetical protein F383_28488 [Gossypium arboreum]|uniref:Uncharacterized protein n=1 Tax=Gossypium arboreum TaxID=29729 RepID=A0A0B0N011_GOSAR|nr:hypothetical protein F383_28488 [Gossypium arboreum]
MNFWHILWYKSKPCDLAKFGIVFWQLWYV